MCLGDHKGRTKAKGFKNEKFSLPQDLLDIGRKFYKNNMDRIFEILSKLSIGRILQNRPSRQAILQYFKNSATKLQNI